MCPIPLTSCVFLGVDFCSKQKRWLTRFYEREIMQVLEIEMNMDQGWEEVALM